MINITETLRDHLINKLIPSGIEVYVAENNMKAITMLEKIPVNIVVIDIDSKNIDYLEFMKNIKEKPNHDKLRLIVITKIVEKDVLSKFVPYGLIGILSKNLEIEMYDKRIIYFIDSHLYENERRKNVRIAPKNGEKLLVRLPIIGKPNDRTEGKIIDLSIQGVAFSFINTDHKNYYMLNQEIKSAELDIKNRRYLTDVKLVRVGDVSVAVYINPKETFINAVSKFIFEKLEEQYEIE